MKRVYLKNKKYRLDNNSYYKIWNKIGGYGFVVKGYPEVLNTTLSGYTIWYGFVTEFTLYPSRFKVYKLTDDEVATYRTMQELVA